jgi:hypothetical protein
MAQLIPSYGTCQQKMNAGERRFASRLIDLLEEDYLCWYDIPLGKKRRYPDFIILHPARGILFLEVKDWKFENIRHLSHQTADVLCETGLKTLSNPIEQARQCGYQVVQMLERDVQLQQSLGQHKGKLCFPYGYGAVLTNITRKQINDAIAEEFRSKVLPDHLLICKDEMTESTSAEIFQQKLWGMFNYQFGSKLTLPQIDRIRWHLFPEIRLEGVQTGFFAAEAEGSDSGERLSAAIPDIVQIMDMQQEQLARSLGDGHRVIHGVAGSGKTLILGYRCLHLAEALHKPILVLCFNITLASRLRAFIGERGLAGKVQVYHFHDRCGEMLRAYHVDLINSRAPIWERQVESVIAAVARGMIPTGQYGALMIDEGHDFEPQWLTLVTQMVDPDTNSLLLLYDDAQSIYKRKSAMKFSLASVGIQAQGRTTVLRLNYRNTREILNFAYQFAKDYFAHSDNQDIPLIEPQAAGKNGAAPVVRCFESLAHEVDYIVRCVEDWSHRGKRWRDIAILYPGGSAGKFMAEKLKARAIPFAWLAKSDYKRQYDPDADRVNLMAIPSSKGLEFDTVVILDGSYVQSASAGEEHPVEEGRRLYVGFTRAKERLLVSYHRDNAIGTGLANLR